MRILIVDDDQKATDLLAKGLREECFVVDVAYSGEDGDEMASVTAYDAIVLDWRLPDKEGIAVCRELRARGIATPVLMLTARDTVEDRVTGLNTGADDYLTKPFSFTELVARIHALLRRSDVVRPTVLMVADLTLDPLNHQVTRAGRTISLTPKEYAILEILMRHPGEAVPRSQIAEGVWEMEIDALVNLLDVHVGHLRKKIDDAGTAPLIRTIRGRGYLIGARDA